MIGTSVRRAVLLFCGLIAAGEASAADRRPDLEAWLSRLNGRFTIKLEIPPESRCGALSLSNPNGPQVCTSSKAVTYVSAVDCRGTGQGPGLYCTFDELRREPDKNGGEGAPASLFNNELPSRMLLGIDPVAQQISMMFLDPGGAAYGGMAAPAGNNLTVTGRCDLAGEKRSTRCTWRIAMRASSDGRRIVMTRSRSPASASLGGPNTFELAKQE